MKAKLRRPGSRVTWSDVAPDIITENKLRENRIVAAAERAIGPGRVIRPDRPVPSEPPPYERLLYGVLAGRYPRPEVDELMAQRKAIHDRLHNPQRTGERPDYCGWCRR